METHLTEIAPDIYRLSTYVSDADIVFNQYLIDAEEPLLFHAGLRALHPLISAAVERYCRWSGCAGSPSGTWRPTSAAR
ncbi:MAG: hypothetical protein JF630_05030 [Geodermatophilales bacterium]|nr:hypothetical protein [Geodermatophilales bacterium]